ncbi:NEK-like kinase protein [Giardia duodenalis ATCC 50581]|uniref:NEK-like kinase protein n=1 Tax=Giardia intestinalis (strain ATCC 50581 / GS clone H7) TaxID=598745 RepID=C6LTZ6_GIAIB|nr:NEK-like kinase protein [Giardia intestinalis ATCC 50581]
MRTVGADACSDFYSSTILSRRKHVTVLLGTTSTTPEPHIAKLYNMKEIRESSLLQFVNDPSCLHYIKHPRLLRCYGCRINPRRDTATIFEEFGQVSLQKLISEHRKTGKCFSESALWSVAAAVASLLQYLHQHDNKTFYNSISNNTIHLGSMVHGNLKPSNVYIVHQKDISSFEFSDVKVTHPAVYRNFGTSRNAAGKQIDELIYHAPEILNTLSTSPPPGLSAYDVNTACCGAAPDLWFLGIILYEMMALAKPSHTGHTILSRLDSPETISAAPELDLSNTYSTDIFNIITQLLHPDPLQRPRIQSLLLTGPIMSILQGSPLLSPLNQRRSEFPVHSERLIGGPRARENALESASINARIREHLVEDVTISGLSNIDHKEVSGRDTNPPPSRNRELDLETVIEVLNSSNRTIQHSSTHMAAPFTSKSSTKAAASVAGVDAFPHDSLPVTKTAIHLVGSRGISQASTADDTDDNLALEMDTGSNSDSETMAFCPAPLDNPPNPIKKDFSQAETPSIMQDRPLRSLVDGEQVLRPGTLETINEDGPERASTCTRLQERRSESIQGRSISARPRQMRPINPYKPRVEPRELVSLLISNTPSNGSTSKYSYRNPEDPLVYKQIYVRGAFPNSKHITEGMHADISHTIFGLSPATYVSFDTGRSTSVRSQSTSHRSKENTILNNASNDGLSGDSRSIHSALPQRSISQGYRPADRKMISWRSKEDALANAHQVKRDKKGNTQLMLAALSNNLKAVHEYISQAGLQNKFGFTAMMIAAKRGFVEIVKILMNQESGITTKRKCGVPSATALILAAMCGQAEVVYLLHEKERGIQDKLGMTALMHAAMRGYTDIVLILRNAEACKRDFHGCTALLMATEHNRLDIVKLLVDQEAQMSTTDGYKYGSGFTALMCAARLGFVQAVELLVKKEANMMHMPADRETGGFTALVWAAREGHLACIKVLAPYEATLSGSLAIIEGEKSLANSKAKKQRIRLLIRKHMCPDDMESSALNKSSGRVLRTCDI